MLKTYSQTYPQGYTLFENCFSYKRLGPKLKVKSHITVRPCYLQILVNVPLFSKSGGFDFALPENIPCPPPGKFVIVPWARSCKLGVVLKAQSESQLQASRIRAIAGVVEDWPPLPQAVLKLASFAADYYHANVGEVLLSSVPESLSRSSNFSVKHPIASYLKGKRKHTLLAQQRLPPTAPVALTASQIQVLNWLSQQQGFAVGLLWGVTGSGKTEVYLQAVARALGQGKTALLLVPEIALTEGLAAQVRARFPQEQVATITSNIASGARAAAWLATLKGKVRIVVGTRSAVFAPLDNLGLVIVDEEHDASYKQQEGARIHARDLAVMRGRISDCQVLLGSATPSLESWANAQAGRYTLLRMPTRAHANAVLPSIELINTKAAASVQGLSEPLATALKIRFERKEQSLVFINRRGFAPVLCCEACAWIADCSNCSAHFALHRASTRSGYKLICHHCSAQQPVPQACPVCGNKDLLPKGQGTQKLEEKLLQLLPNAKIARMDRDSTRRRGASKDILAAMDRGLIDILTGTQMIAKGHDFENLTLVGVLGSDSLLMSPDFRAEERLFALLMQVSGRSGRGERPGQVLIETRLPRHPLFRELLAQDYEASATRLLAERENLGLPPYTSLALIRAQAPSDGAAQGFLTQARLLAIEELENSPSSPSLGIRLYHPRPMAVPRVANQARWQLLIEGRSRLLLQNFLQAWLLKLRTLRTAKVRWHIDVDPLEI